VLAACKYQELAKMKVIKRIFELLLYMKRSAYLMKDILITLMYEMINL